MSFHHDLLVQAEHLATLDPRRPKQANLRRSVSASYYALFHLLTSEASALYASGTGLAARINRSYSHSEMRKVSELIANSKLPKGISPDVKYSTPPDLKLVANSFIELQQARHDADYDLSRIFDRGEALAFVQSSRDAFEAWERVRKLDDARIYLACFHLWKRWDELAR
jgi:hypothetical protein